MAPPVHDEGPGRVDLGFLTKNKKIKKNKKKVVAESVFTKIQNLLI